jgi:hypothetical protein
MVIADHPSSLINRTIYIIEGAMSIDVAVLEFSHINRTTGVILGAMTMFIVIPSLAIGCVVHAEQTNVYKEEGLARAIRQKLRPPQVGQCAQGGR